MEATWRKLISKEMQRNKDSWEKKILLHPENLDLDEVFDHGFGASKGKSFLLWTDDFVYFPIEYEGFETVSSAPRKPSRCVLLEHKGIQDFIRG